MSSAYINPAEYIKWGLTASPATDLLVLKASTLIDQHLNRVDVNGATVGLGVNTFVERLFLPEDRNLVRLAHLPFVSWDTSDTNNPSGIRGRYGYGRRGSSINSMYTELSMLTAAAAFGGPPAWTSITSSQVDVFPLTGEVWIPAGIYAAHYEEVEVRYQAGYGTIPDDIRLAVTMLIANFQNKIPGVQTLKAGDRQLQFFSNEMIDDATKAILAKYRAVSLR